MVLQSPALRSPHHLEEALTLMNKWRLAVSASGFLWIRPMGSELRLVELARFIQRLRRACGDGFPSEMLVDLSAIHVVGAPKSLVRRLLVHFARSVGTHCSVIE